MQINMRSAKPEHTIDFTEQLQCFEICGSDFAYNLVCIAFDKKLTLGLVQFPEESETDTFSWERLKNLHHESRCHALSFAPDTSLVSMPKCVTFCTAGADFKIRIFRTDLQDADTVQTLSGHTSYVNDVAWDTQGEFLASVSDDFKLKIWAVDSNFEVVTTFCLTSAGVAVKWHPEEPQKVLVAEKKGVIHFYNVRSQQAIVSVESPKCPMLSADWSLNNRFSVVALAGGEVVTWDLRRPCVPTDVKQVHEDGGLVVRFSPNSELVVASIGRPVITLKVFASKSTVPLVETQLKLFGGLAWHYRLPYVGAAQDRKLCFWRVQLK